MIYEPTYIYPNVLNAQGERCFYTMDNDNTFRILINSDYPIASCTYRIYCPDGELYKTGTVMGLNFYTNNIDGTQNLLEIGGVSLLNGSNKVRINNTTEINPNVFSDTTWTYQLSFTDTQGTPMDTNLYAFYITPSEDFVSISGNASISITGRTQSFTGNFTYATQPISWIQWSVYDSSDNLVYTTGMVYRSVATNFTFDGFDTGETYTVEFSASDTRGNISRATQEVSVSYTLVNQSNVIRTTVQDDSSMLVDWSGLQPIIGKAYDSNGDEIDTPSFFVNDIPSWGHNSIEMNGDSEEKKVIFQSSDNLDIAIEETDYITWSGALYGNTTDILTAISNDGVMSLSLVGFDDGLYPNNTLYPSSSLYPKAVTLGRFKYTLPNGTIIYSDQNIDATNSWFFVELSPNKITVHREEYYKA